MKINGCIFALLLCTCLQFLKTMPGSCLSKSTRPISESSIFRSDSVKGFTQWPRYQPKIKHNMQMQRSFKLIANTCKPSNRRSFSFSSRTKTK